MRAQGAPCLRLRSAAPRLAAPARVRRSGWACLSCVCCTAEQQVSDALHQLAQGRRAAVRRSVLVSAVAVGDKVLALLDSTRAGLLLCVPPSQRGKGVVGAWP